MHINFCARTWSMCECGGCVCLRRIGGSQTRAPFPRCIASMTQFSSSKVAMNERINTLVVVPLCDADKNRFIELPELSMAATGRLSSRLRHMNFSNGNKFIHIPYPLLPCEWRLIIHPFIIHFIRRARGTRTKAVTFTFYSQLMAHLPEFSNTS